MSPIGLGIIGLSADTTAWAPKAHVGPLKSAPLSEKYTLKAVATSRPETAKTAAKAYGLPENKGYSSADDIANDPEVDMVVVSVKTPMHKQLTLPALKAKKPVYVEWPLGTGLAEAKELAALAKKQRVKTVVGLQARRTPVIAKAKEIIDSGTLGRIYNTTLVASGSNQYALPGKYDYVNDPYSGANWTTIPCAHILDPFCYLLGEFESLNATSATVHPKVTIGEKETDRQVSDSVSVTGILESGATASFTNTITTPATPGLLQWIIAGEKGSLKFEGAMSFLAFMPPTLSQTVEGKWKEIEVPKSEHFGGIAEVYESFAVGKTEGLVDFEEAVKRHRLIDAIERSSKSGERATY